MRGGGSECGASGVGAVNDEFGLRVGIVTETGARVGVGPAGVFVSWVITPGWIGAGVNACSVTGAKGSYVGYGVMAGGEQDARARVINKQYVK